jgi:hypothetical protein
MRKVLFREVFKVSFEAVAVYDDVDCKVAYGTLKVEAIVAPALRLCMHREVRDLAVKLYGDFVAEVEKTSYYICIPPHRYVTYSDTPDILLLLRTGYATVLLCRADAETCRQLRDATLDVSDVKHAYTTVKNIIATRRRLAEEHKP